MTSGKAQPGTGPLYENSKPPITVNQLAKHALLFKQKAPSLFEDTPIVLHEFADRMQAEEPFVYAGFRAYGIEQFRTSMLEIQSYVHWVNYGMPAFEVTCDLLAGLVLTDPSNVNPADVNLPFGTFAVSLPRGFWSVTSTIDNTKIVEGVTLMVHSYEGVAGEELRRALCITLLCDDGTCLWDRVTWPRAETFGGWLDNTDVDYQLLGEVLDEEHRLQMILRRVVVNLALFVAEHGRGRRKQTAVGLAKKIRKRRPKRAAKMKKPAVEIWTLGHKVKLSSELIAAARASIGSTSERWRLSKRICVRGHHRHQAHGPKHSLRKWIWIQPYWKGPKDGERLAHLYTDGESDDQ